jgi:parvulin-like peptidyl-prolyl isomerase
MRLVCGLLAVAAGAAWAADIAVVESIVAKVNNEIITRTELDRSRRQIEGELRQQGLRDAQLSSALEARSQNVLRDRIDTMLLVHKAKELNINVESEISKYFADWQRKEKIADPEKFQQKVREQTGMPFEDVKNEVRNGMMTQRVVRQEVGGRINPPTAEIEKYYNDHKTEFVREERVFLRELLVSTEGKDPSQLAALEKKAKDLSARAKKGERFPELAQDNSDAVTAQDGGAVGWVKRGDLAANLEELIWKNDRGFVTDAVKMPNGWLILRVDEKHKAGQADLEEVREEVMGRLYNERMQPAIREYLTRLRSEAFLEIRDGYTDTAAAPGKDTKWTDPAQLKPETVTKEEVAAKPRRKRLLWAIPIPGTKSDTTSSSKN